VRHRAFSVSPGRKPEARTGRGHCPSAGFTRWRRCGPAPSWAHGGPAQDRRRRRSAACELSPFGFVALGALEALGRTVMAWRRYGDFATRKDIWLRFATSILIALEFAWPPTSPGRPSPRRWRRSASGRDSPPIRTR
jgi:hypothetical protein